MAATHRAVSSLEVVKTSSIHHFSFLPALGLAQIFFIKAIFSGRLCVYVCDGVFYRCERKDKNFEFLLQGGGPPLGGTLLPPTPSAGAPATPRYVKFWARM